MKRLLCIVSNMNAGGAETFLMKIYRNIDKTKFQMDFIVSITEKGFYNDEILKNGGKIFYVNPKSKNPLKSFIGIKNIVKKNNYKYVIRVNEHSLSVIDLIAAKFGGAKTLILRSSNSQTTGSLIKKILHKIFIFLPRTIPNIKFAPSTEAAIYTFGKKQLRNNKVILLHNAIPYKDFMFDKIKREQMRKSLNLSNKLVIGHIGRFNEQKNHKFLIKIFKEVKEKNKDAVLLLVGNGNLQNQIKEQVEKLELSDSVVFLGVREDIPQILMAMDIYVFPSLFEGMPNTVIEAQAAGLKCIVSNTITKEANITGSVKYLDLNKSEKYWCDIIQEELKNNTREDKSKDFKNKGYDIIDISRYFINTIFNMRGNK